MCIALAALNSEPSPDRHQARVLWIDSTANRSRNACRTATSVYASPWPRDLDLLLAVAVRLKFGCVGCPVYVGSGYRSLIPLSALPFLTSSHASSPSCSRHSTTPNTSLAPRLLFPSHLFPTVLHLRIFCPTLCFLLLFLHIRRITRICRPNSTLPQPPSSNPPRFRSPSATPEAPIYPATVAVALANLTEAQR